MKKIFATILMFFVFVPAFADACKYEEIVLNVRNSCGDVIDDLEKLKTMAGINTAITSLGTVGAAGALYAGVSKKQIDAKAAELEKQLDNIENMSDEEFLAFLKSVAEYEEQKNRYQEICSAKKDLEKQSKKLGNVRTGLMAANTATAIAGTVVANKNKKESRTISEKINDCVATVNLYHDSVNMARFDCNQDEYEKLRQIDRACSAFSPKHLEKITKSSTGATVSSAINIGTGAIGTATSAAANSQSVRNNDTDAGTRREKNLNTTANVFSGASAVASGVATIFNAKTLKAIKDNLLTAQSCMEALK